MPGLRTKRSDDRRHWIRQTVEQFEDPLVRYVSRILGDVESARDVVQETFLKLCDQDREQLESHLAEWLYTVSRNRALDLLRKEGRMNRAGDPEPTFQVVSAPLEDPSERLEEQEQFNQILNMLRALPDSQQEVVRLRFQEGFSYKEISRITGLSVSNVGYLLHMALKTLRSRLGVLTSGLKKSEQQA